MPAASLGCSVALSYLLKNLPPFLLDPLHQLFLPQDPLLRHGCYGLGLDVLWNRAHDGGAEDQGCRETVGAVRASPGAHGRNSVRLAVTESPCPSTCGRMRRLERPGGLAWTCGTTRARWAHDPLKTNPAMLEGNQDGSLRYLEKQEIKNVSEVDIHLYVTYVERPNGREKNSQKSTSQTECF